MHVNRDWNWQFIFVDRLIGKHWKGTLVIHKMKLLVAWSLLDRKFAGWEFVLFDVSESSCYFVLTY